MVEQIKQRLIDLGYAPVEALDNHVLLWPHADRAKIVMDSIHHGYLNKPKEWKEAFVIFSACHTMLWFNKGCEETAQGWLDDFDRTML